MDRDIYKELLQWKNNMNRKPLLLRGARQVGKSWLIRRLGQEFDNFIEINFEEHPEVKVFFEKSLEPNQILINLSNYFGVRITPGKTLVFFDEMQICPRAITSLRYFYEKMPELHLAGAGSLIEFALREISVPVGRIEFIYVYPMNLGEFLVAAGRRDLREMLIGNGLKPIPGPLHKLLLEHLRDYVLVGGMPQAVSSFIETKSFLECSKIHSSLIETFRADFAKYAKLSQIKYIRTVFDAIPGEAGKKIVFKNISEHGRGRDIGEALDILEMAGLAYKGYHSSSNGIPLGAEKDSRKFKVLFFDAGLALKILGLNLREFILNPDIMLVNKGSIAELLAGLELISYSDFHSKPEIYYWHREAKASCAEIDYVISKNNRVVPVEIKSGSEGKMHSMHLFLSEKKCAEKGLRIYSGDFSQNVNFDSIPLYAIEGWLKN
ncbi:MAG: ATP-binding protein [Lentisphaerota bacterium]